MAEAAAIAPDRLEEARATGKPRVKRFLGVKAIQVLSIRACPIRCRPLIATALRFRRTRHS
jgi:hypothetical protein